MSPLTSGRLSHSSGPLNGGQNSGSLTDSPPVSPSDMDDVKVFYYMCVCVFFFLNIYIFIDNLGYLFIYFCL